MAGREELFAALKLLLGARGRPAPDAVVADFLSYADGRRLDPSRTFIAERGGRLLWAMLPLPSPGRTALLLGPGFVSDPAAARAAAGLADVVVEHLAAGGIHLAQILLDPADTKTAAAYGAARFHFVAELLYLAVAPRRAAPPPLPPPGHVWLTYSPAAHALFAEAILTSYQESLDCPALNGLRHIDDVIAGHRASGEFDPRLWMLLCRDSTSPGPAAPQRRVTPCGVLLVARLPHSETAELVYFGVTPAARGQGLGDLLMRQAITSARAAGCAQISLAVDAANHPALQLYYRHGMQRVGSKIALLRDLRTGPHPCRAEGGGE